MAVTERVSTAGKVAKALRMGDLVRPAVCSTCGKTGLIEGHHEDYKKPLEVVWLCQRCHQEQHLHQPVARPRVLGLKQAHPDWDIRLIAGNVKVSQERVMQILVSAGYDKTSLLDRKTFLQTATKVKRNEALLAYVREHPNATSTEVAIQFGVTAARVRCIWHGKRAAKLADAPKV